MKVVSINLGNTGSTGMITRKIAAKSKAFGIEVIQAYAGNPNQNTDKESDIVICSEFFRLINRTVTYFTGLEGGFSLISTLKLIGKLKRIKPDIIHLHNIHGWYLNYFLLFNYLKKCKAEVVWTLHDCWAFTGHCPHFQISKCEKWKTGCYCCPSYLMYPKSYIDNSRLMFSIKKKLFTSIEDMTIITPSIWLSELVKQSFLSKYKTEVINNGIDLSIFKPTPSNYREKMNLMGSYVILGVSGVWSYSKGLDVFSKLADVLDERFRIVLVGTNDTVEKELPSRIITIRKTNSPEELAMLYSMADLFINPTREDTFPTVNIEALACGTPVLTYKTGGSPEIIDSSCGCSVGVDDFEALVSEIQRLSNIYISEEACIRRSKLFDMEDKYSEYFELYRELHASSYKRKDQCDENSNY